MSDRQFTPDMFALAEIQRRMEALQASPEWKMVANVAAMSLQERPTEPAWKWAEREVFLDEKMTSEPGYYNTRKTPWAREWQELPLRPEVRVGVLMKSSRVGGTEAGFNIIRWMPSHWPGNAGVVYPEDKQARDVADRRLLASMKKNAAAYLTADPNDVTLSIINLINMVVKMGPSGSARMFTEWWVRFFMLDEVEEHSTSDTTSTYDRALSRQADVADALLWVLSKPKRAGGPIDQAYVQGTQKKFLLPCPRCDRPIELLRDFFQSPDCQNADGTWDLPAVIKNTRYQCQLCQGTIEEGEKYAMTDAGVWVPTAMEHRRRGSDGKPVPPAPGVESYQISDYYSHHPRVSWGHLRAMYLLAFHINPTTTAQTHYINNHEGLPDEPKLIEVDKATIEALVAGRVERKQIKAADGTIQEVSVTVGIEGGFRLCYKNGNYRAKLPVKPVILLAFADKQKTEIKFLVFAIELQPQIGAYLVDVGRVDDEDAYVSDVLQRPYYVEGEKEPMYPQAGFIDSRYRGQAVYKMCLQAAKLGKQIWPVRGEGDQGRVKKKKDRKDEVRTKLTRGKLMRFVADRCELGPIMVRYFKDHELKTEFYLNKLQKRIGWRIWLPTDYPSAIANEWTAERYDEDTDEWVHNETKYGPNDLGDAAKYCVLWMLEFLNQLLIESGLPPIDEGLPESDDEAPADDRDYELQTGPDKRVYEPPAEGGD